MTVTMDSPRARLGAERRFYMAMILAMIVLLLLGFSRTVFLRPFFPDQPAPPEVYFYAVHGTLFFGRMTLLFVQGSLISARNTALHMRLGTVAYVMEQLMIVVGEFGRLMAE